MLNFIYNDVDFQHKLDEAGHSSEIFEKHIHPFDEILYFINGGVLYTVEAESRKLEPGDLIFIPAANIILQPLASHRNTNDAFLSSPTLAFLNT